MIMIQFWILKFDKKKLLNCLKWLLISICSSAWKSTLIVWLSFTSSRPRCNIASFPPSNNITIITQMNFRSTSQPQMRLKSPNLYLEMLFHSARSYTPRATIHRGNNTITIQSIAYKGIDSAWKHTGPDWNVHSVCITSTASVPIVISKDMCTHTRIYTPEGNLLLS